MLRNLYCKAPGRNGLHMRKQLLQQNLLPGGAIARTQDTAV